MALEKKTIVNDQVRAIAQYWSNRIRESKKNDKRKQLEEKLKKMDTEAKNIYKKMHERNEYGILVDADDIDLIDDNL